MYYLKSPSKAWPAQTRGGYSFHDSFVNFYRWPSLTSSRLVSPIFTYILIDLDLNLGNSDDISVPEEEQAEEAQNDEQILAPGPIVPTNVAPLGTAP